MQDRVTGAPLPVLEVALEPGESVIAETGEFGWMTDGIDMATGAPGGAAGAGLGGILGKGGVMGALKRVAGGGSFLFNTFTATRGPGMVAFPAKLPGSIFPIEVGPGREYRSHRKGFLAGTPGIEISAALNQSFRGGIFGGEGFVLQAIGGAGRAWVELSGHVSAYTLQAGQSLRVHPGHVGLFDASVTFQVMRVQGLANRYLGADGHWQVVLTGPGQVWLQSMPVPILAGALAPYLAGQSSRGAAEGGTVGGVLGDLFSS